MFVSSGVRRSHRRPLLRRWDDGSTEQNVTERDDQAAAHGLLATILRLAQHAESVAVSVLRDARIDGDGTGLCHGGKLTNNCQHDYSDAGRHHRQPSSLSVAAAL